VRYFGYNNGMARPPKNIADRKDVDLRIPVTAEQKEQVLSAARMEGLEMAAWARPILIKAAQNRLKRT
jgi:predicted glycosyltransferase